MKSEDLIEAITKLFDKLPKETKLSEILGVLELVKAKLLQTFQGLY